MGERGAAFDIHAAVGPLGHDLQGLARAAHDAQAHQLEARLFDDGFEDRFQMRMRAQNDRNSKSKAFPPRRSFRTATQQTSCCLGWAAMYAGRVRLSSPRRRKIRANLGVFRAGTPIVTSPGTDVFSVGWPVFRGRYGELKKAHADRAQGQQRGNKNDAIVPNLIARRLSSFFFKAHGVDLISPHEAEECRRAMQLLGFITGRRPVGGPCLPVGRSRRPSSERPDVP